MLLSEDELAIVKEMSLQNRFCKDDAKIILSQKLLL